MSGPMSDTEKRWFDGVPLWQNSFIKLIVFEDFEKSSKLCIMLSDKAYKPSADAPRYLENMILITKEKLLPITEPVSRCKNPLRRENVIAL